MLDRDSRSQAQTVADWLCRLTCLYVAACLELSVNWAAIGDTRLPGPLNLMSCGQLLSDSENSTGLRLPWLLVVATGCSRRMATTTAILWMSVIGCMMDLLAHDRLGLHLAICGLGMSVWHAIRPQSSHEPIWHWPCLAAGFTVANLAASLQLQHWLATSSPTLAINSELLRQGLIAAALVSSWQLLSFLVRRMLSHPGGKLSLVLQNQWAGLAEDRRSLGT